MKSPLIDPLNALLAACVDLHDRLKHAHWNVVGPGFLPTHELFDKLAGSALGYADAVGEHIRFLGGEAYGTSKAASGSALGPYTIGIAPAEAHLGRILASLNGTLDLARAGIQLSIRDQITADVFIEIGRGLGRDIYLVRSHLEKLNG